MYMRVGENRGGKYKLGFGCMRSRKRSFKRVAGGEEWVNWLLSGLWETAGSNLIGGFFWARVASTLSVCLWYVDLLEVDRL